VELTGTVKSGLVTLQIGTALLVKVVRVCGTDRYGKMGACDSAEWSSAVGEG
jgi:hypothetical protein